MISFTLPGYQELDKYKYRLNTSGQFSNSKKTQLLVNDLPEKTGVYFLVDDCAKIEYIGSTINLKSKTSVHLYENKSKGNSLYFLPTKTLIEAQLYATLYINYYKPRLNIKANINKNHKNQDKSRHKPPYLERIISSEDSKISTEELNRSRKIIKRIF